MILSIYQFLTSGLGIKLPAAFAYSSTRMMLAAFTAFLFTMLLGPFCIKKLYEMKTGQSIRVEDCPLLAELHREKKQTPTMGGILILVAILLSLFLWMDWKSPFTLILLLTTLFFGWLGGIDDYLKLKYKNSKGLSAKRKFVFQNIFGFLIGVYLFWPAISNTLHQESWFIPPVAKEQVNIGNGEKVEEILSLQEYMSCYFVPFFKEPVFVLKGAGIILGIFITMFVVTGASNAVNLTDGLDGLAAGCVMMVAGVLGVFAFFSNNHEIARYLNIFHIEQSGEIAIYLFALIGASLGFLWFNGYPAQVFMGDTGSLALGGILGVGAILLRREVLLGIVGGIFVIETVSVILQVASYKLRNRKRIFLCTPLHHHFEYKGWSETKVVLRFWIIGFILALIGIASLKFQ